MLNCLFHENRYIYVYIEIPLLNDRTQVWIQIGLLTHSRRVALAFLSNLRDKTPSFAGASVMKRATDKSRCQSSFETSKRRDSKEFGRKSFSSFFPTSDRGSSCEKSPTSLAISVQDGSLSLTERPRCRVTLTSHSHSVISLK